MTKASLAHIAEIPPPHLIIHPSSNVQGSARKQQMFYIAKDHVKEKKSLIETAASRFGAKEGGWGKREMREKIRLQPEFGERCCVPLCSVTDWNHLDKKYIH